MPNTPKSLEKLHEAIELEKRELAVREARYAALTRKMHDYQMKGGTAPSLEEFEQWRADVEKTVELQRLKAGVPQ